MSRLRLGVIGAGSWAVSSHLPNFARQSEAVEFDIVNRRDRAMLREIQGRFGFKRSTTDWRDVIDAKPDIVLVAGPASQHYTHVRAALEAGSHVLCEKPFTIASAEAWHLAELAKQNDRHLVIAFGWNYNPAVVAAAQLLESHGGVGSIEYVSLRMASATREILTNRPGYTGASSEVPPRLETWTNPALSGGGYGQAQLSHGLAALLELTGLRGQRVFAVMGRRAEGGIELHDAIAVEFGEGAIGGVVGASVHSGARADKHQFDLHIVGSEGQVVLDLWRELVWRHRADEGEVTVPIASDAGRYECAGPVTAIVELAAGRGRNRSTAELGARTVEILEAAYLSSSSGDPVSIPPTP